MKSIILLITSLFFCLNTSAQTKKKYTLNLDQNNGYEYNLLNSPFQLFNNDNGQYFDINSVRKSSISNIFKTDLKYSKRKSKKHQIDFNLNAWYQNYSQYAELNQTNIKSSFSYKRIASKKKHFGFSIKAYYSDEIMTTLMGSEVVNELRSPDYLKRSLNHLNHEGKLFYIRKFKRNTFTISQTHHGRNYFQDTSTTNRLSFDDNISSGNFIIRTKKSRKLFLNLSFTDRVYHNYLALDSNGSRNTSTFKRHYHFYSLGMKLEQAIGKRVSITPNLKYRRLKDLYEDFFSKTDLEFSLQLKIKSKRLNIRCKGAYKSVEFDQKFAPSFSNNSNLLRYDYLNQSSTITYLMSNRLKIKGHFSYEYRLTNAEIHSWTTRRSYDNYQVSLGLQYKVIDQTIKKKKVRNNVR